MRLIWIIIALIGLWACQSESSTTQDDTFDHIKDKKVRQLLKEATIAAGGRNIWNSKKQLSFQKYVALYDSTGTAEQENWQTHTYTYQPIKKVEINWERDSAAYEIIAKNDQLQRLVNGGIDTSVSQQSLENTVLSATFVISLPFKLLDEGVQLSYQGKKQLDTGQSVEVLRAVYDATQNEQHSNQDVWELYFDASDHRMLGYQVQHDDHISYVLNESFHVVEGLVFPHLRKSYRVNENGERLFLRAAYEYKDFTVRF